MGSCSLEHVEEAIAGLRVVARIDMEIFSNAGCTIRERNNA